jgi:hypothetical protein
VSGTGEEFDRAARHEAAVAVPGVIHVREPVQNPRLFIAEGPVTGPVFACPCCGATSSHPDDIAQNYCARCHWWTGDPQLGPPHLAEPCPERKASSETEEEER